MVSAIKACFLYKMFEFCILVWKKTPYNLYSIKGLYTVLMMTKIFYSPDTELRLKSLYALIKFSYLTYHKLGLNGEVTKMGLGGGEVRLGCRNSTSWDWATAKTGWAS